MTKVLLNYQKVQITLVKSSPEKAVVCINPSPIYQKAIKQLILSDNQMNQSLCNQTNHLDKANKKKRFLAHRKYLTVLIYVNE